MKGFWCLGVAAILVGACDSEEFPPCTPRDEGAGAGGPWPPTDVTVGATVGAGGYGSTSDGERYGYSHNAAGQVCACDAFDHESMRCVDTPPGDDDAVASGQDFVCPPDRLNTITGDCYPFSPSEIADLPTNSDSGGEPDQTSILKEDLDGAQEAGGVLCISPNDCVKKCVAEAKYCWAEHAAHPHKAGQIGNLYDCIDRFPKAKYGGSYTCLYKYPNGDACIFAYAAKLGPITFPAPPPLCVYKG